MIEQSQQLHRDFSHRLSEMTKEHQLELQRVRKDSHGETAELESHINSLKKARLYRVPLEFFYLQM